MATVDRRTGAVHAIGAGTTSITLRAGGVRATATVTVTG